VIRFLPIDADIADPSAVRFNKFFALNEHSPDPQQGS
jgi:hypothetical protein